MNSAFKFHSYKVDHVQLSTSKKDLGFLVGRTYPANLWNVRLQVRDPQYFTKSKLYVGGIDCVLFLSEESTPADQRAPENGIVVLNAGIAGAFGVDEGRFETAVEDTLVRTQIPAILLPYLRGAMTTLLANAGFGSIILPLINIQEFAKNYLGDKKVTVCD